MAADAYDDMTASAEKHCRRADDTWLQEEEERLASPVAMADPAAAVAAAAAPPSIDVNTSRHGLVGERPHLLWASHGDFCDHHHAWTGDHHEIR